MSLFRHFHADVVDALAGLVADGALPAGLDAARVSVEPPREAGHGDVTTNAAMVLAKQAKMKPRDLADLLAARLAALETVTDTEIAGPGFINFHLADSVWLAELAAVLGAGSAYGDSDMGAGAPVNVEYVSANPTGPLHVGHLLHCYDLPISKRSFQEIHATTYRQGILLRSPYNSLI